MHLAPDAEQVLGPTTHLATGQPHGGQAIPQQLHRDREPVLPFTALGGHLLLHLPESLGLQDLEGQILQLPLEAADAEAVGQGGVDLAGLAGDALLLLGLQGAERAHVVETVGQLHQHHADVAGHSQEHAAQVLGLGFGLVGEVNAAELGHPLHQGPHLGAEAGLDVLRGDLGVLHHVVQKAGGDHRRTGADVPQEIGHRNRVNDVGLAAGSKLPRVKLEGEVEGGRQQGLGVGRAGVAIARRHVPHALGEPFRQRDPVILGTCDRAAPGGWLGESFRCCRRNTDQYLSGGRSLGNRLANLIHYNIRNQAETVAGIGLNRTRAVRFGPGRGRGIGNGPAHSSPRLTSIVFRSGHPTAPAGPVVGI